MIQFLISLELDEIHMVEHPFNKDPKNITFCQGGPNLGGRTDGKFREMNNNRDIYCNANRWWSISKENISPYPPASIFLHARPNLREKVKNPIFGPKFELF